MASLTAKWLAVGIVLAASGPALAEDVLFENVLIFDGTSPTLSAPSNVLVRDNLIAEISTAPIEAGAALRIDGGGRTLMPGLIDAHWHAMLASLPPSELVGEPGFGALIAGREATDTLMRGFTTVRDVGGPVFSLKRAIDDGIVVGPRIYPSGAMITATSGHGDFRQRTDLPRTIGGYLSRMEILGGAMVVDSPDEMRTRVREQFMMGATQIKLTAGGGVSSPFSPLDVTTFTESELRAAVEIADQWHTYVVAHAFTSDSIRRAIAAGAKCIEHGFLMDEETAKYIADSDVWLSLQPLPDALRTNLAEGSVERAKAEEVWPGIDRAYRLAKKYNIKTAWGTDVLFSRALAAQQGAILASLGRWYTPAEALTMATATNAELLEMSGPRNPYPGKLGVVQEGAFADLILVNGNPLDDLMLVADASTNFKIIMKDGVIHKNTLE